MNVTTPVTPSVITVNNSAKNYTFTGTHITAARLHATPEAARCVHCQEKAEQHRRAA